MGIHSRYIVQRSMTLFTQSRLLFLHRLEYFLSLYKMSATTMNLLETSKFLRDGDMSRIWKVKWTLTAAEEEFLQQTWSFIKYFTHICMSYAHCKPMKVYYSLWIDMGMEKFSNSIYLLQSIRTGTWIQICLVAKCFYWVMPSFKRES